MERNDQELLSQLRDLMDQRGWSQTAISLTLGVTQGHLSKILAGKAPLSKRVKFELSEFLVRPNDLHALEKLTLTTLRESSTFRDLINAALRLHKNA